MHFQLSESTEYAEPRGVQQKNDTHRLNASSLVLTLQVFAPVLHSDTEPSLRFCPVFY